ncbi:HlyD family type I secretion periplasmic adaptor subunit [Sulfitobacter sp. S0837]|uniref:HlyD family type I secretion periplasmic adaptor subunit n=1 Tax=Sulfitobacter maritimus TaxID=2741719 RepID=UPI001583F702|nr:HlyD family type I secretion periplasmic adaptor subunit [Sulfitobacter maritimus]NUH65558.1 HlyD family type I secretion periplasmic adaptor subunit [Sulfitobacter maritimus]
MTAVPDLDAIYSDVPRTARGATLFGYAVMLAGLLSFGWWSATAPIAGAVVSGGVFVTTGQNKTVQHFEGGIIEKIHVAEGDVVTEGETLFTLSATAAEADLARLRLSRLRLGAMEARLMAEVEGRETLDYPDQILAASNEAEIRAALAEQQEVFDARRETVNADLTAISHDRTSLEWRLGGMKEELNALQLQAGLFTEEVAAKRTLFERGLTPRSSVLAVERAQSAHISRIARIKAEAAETTERMAGLDAAAESVRTDVVRFGLESLQEVRSQIDDIDEQMRQARDVLDRLNIVSPVEGIVVTMNRYTPGGVIRAGQVVAEIVPLREELVIETIVQPKDIDVVRPGQEASIRLTGLNQRVTPVLSGYVDYVSADALPGDSLRQGEFGDVYLVRVALHAGEELRARDFTPRPGMPAEIQIRTADRTFLNYLTQPLRDSMSRAFRED